MAHPGLIKLDLLTPRKSHYEACWLNLLSYKFIHGCCYDLRIASSGHFRYWRISFRSSDKPKQNYKTIRVPFPGFIPSVMKANTSIFKKYIKNILPDDLPICNVMVSKKLDRRNKIIKLWTCDIKFDERSILVREQPVKVLPEVKKGRKKKAMKPRK